MDDDTMQFSFISLVELFGIGTYGIEADEEVARDTISFGVVEGNDVGVIVMLQILAVHFQNLLIGAENIGYFADFLAIAGSHLFHPLGGFAFLDLRHCDVLGLVSYHKFSFSCKDKGFIKSLIVFLVI